MQFLEKITWIHSPPQHVKQFGTQRGCSHWLLLSCKLVSQYLRCISDFRLEPYKSLSKSKSVHLKGNLRSLCPHSLRKLQIPLGWFWPCRWSNIQEMWFHLFYLLPFSPFLFSPDYTLVGSSPATFLKIGLSSQKCRTSQITINQCTISFTAPQNKCRFIFYLSLVFIDILHRTLQFWRTERK